MTEDRQEIKVALICILKLSWIRIRSISDRIRNPACLHQVTASIQEIPEEHCDLTPQQVMNVLPC